MITTAEVKTFTDTTVSTYDSAIALIVAGVIKFVQGWCRNTLVQADVTEVFGDEDVLVGDDGGVLVLKNRINLTNFSVKYNSGTETSPVWTAEDAANYVVQADKGLVRLVGTIRSMGVNTYQIAYKAGYTGTYPDDLKLACLKLAAAAFNQRRSEGITSESLADAQVNFGRLMTPDIELLLGAYRSLSI